MTSHLCTMLIECILISIVFLTVTASVCRPAIRKSPFGLLMCDRLCHQTVGCGYFFYAPRDLTCYLDNRPTALDREALMITVSKVAGNTSMDISKCSRNSKTYQSRSKKLICLKQYKRHNTKSNDGQVILQPAQHGTTTPRSNTASVQCNDSIGLFQASEADHLDCVKLIVSRGLEDINCRGGEYNFTPVMIASSMGREKVYDFLVSQGCDLYCVDNYNDTLIHVACGGGRALIVKKLLDNGYFDVDARGYHGRTPLMKAAINGHINVFNMLIGKGSNVKNVDDENNNILHLACVGGHVKMVNHILNLNISGIDIECRGIQGRTPLMTAVVFGHVRLLKMLISKGSNVKAVDVNKDSIIHLASWRGNVKMVKYILSLNIDGIGIDSRGGYGSTPVLTVVFFNQRQVTEVLVSAGCNLAVVNDDGNTVLHLACSGGNIDIVKYIISLGTGNEKVENRYGYTPVQTAESHGHKLVAALLR